MDITKKKLPIGIESFEKIIRDEFYYADKTRLLVTRRGARFFWERV